MRVLTTKEESEWLKVLESAVCYDTYHLPIYHRLAEVSGEGSAKMFVFSEDGFTVAVPLLLRAIPAKTDLVDATSVYGYAGPVVSSEAIPEQVISRFEDQLLETFSDMHIVSVFSRLHPLIHQKFVIDRLGFFRSRGETISINLTLPETQQVAAYRSDHKRNIKRLLAQGATCVLDERWRFFDDFIELYYENMKRVDADKSYFFDRQYFYGLRAGLGDSLRLFVCQRDGKTIAGMLVMICNGIIQYHLGATATEYLRMSPMKLLVDTVRLWGVSIGAHVLHLGGGVGSAKDSLFEFKAGFSEERSEFSTWQLIVQDSEYTKLIKDQSLEISDKTAGHDSRVSFPAYRFGSRSRIGKAKSSFGTGSRQTLHTLFTSAGRRVELLRAFRKAYNSLGLQGSIIAVDVDPLAPALSVADRSYLVPPLSSPEYIETLVSLCRKEDVRLVIPLIDPDIPLLAKHCDALAAAGAEVVVAPIESVAIASDKWRTKELFQRLGVSSPNSWLAGQLDPETAHYPLFIKPRFGSAGKDSFKVENAEDLLHFCKHVPDPIIQDFLSGPEITSDVFCNLKGKPLSVVSRRRIEVRSGEVAKGVTIYDGLIASMCIRIAEALQAKGQITVQCMMNDGIPYFTEINARFGGGSPLGIASGCDTPRWLLAEAAGLPVEIPEVGSYKTGLYITRFDASFFLTGPECDRITRYHL